MIVLVAIAAVFLVFTFITALAWGSRKQAPQPIHAVVHRQYAYRNEPHADATTALPNRLRDNPVTDVLN